MDKMLKLFYWTAVLEHIVAAVLFALTGDWIILLWIIAATIWMIDAGFSGRRADRYCRELIEALEESAKIHFDCLKLTIENYGLKTKNDLLEKDYNKRQIRRKMHFDRLRNAQKSAKIEQ